MTQFFRRFQAEEMPDYSVIILGIKLTFCLVFIGKIYDRTLFMLLLALKRAVFHLLLSRLMQTMFKVSSISCHTCSQSNSPLFNSSIDNTLIEQSTLLHKTLFEMIHILYAGSIHSLLEDAPDLVVHWIKDWPQR